MRKFEKYSKCAGSPVCRRAINQSRLYTNEPNVRENESRTSCVTKHNDRGVYYARDLRSKLESKPARERNVPSVCTRGRPSKSWP